MTKPEPGRTRPIRRAASAAKPKVKVAPDPAPRASGAQAGKSQPKPPVSEAIAQAVRRAYDVIGENMAQGQAAAEHFRAGEYNIRDVPGDLNALARRLITLTRDVSLAACDVLEQLVDDPRVMGAAGAAASGGEPGTRGEARRDAAPGGFRSPPQPPGGPTLGAGAPGATQAPKKAGRPAKGPPQDAVKLQVVFKGGAAVLRAATYVPPDAPSPVFCPGLVGPDSAAPIRGIAFGPGETQLDLKVTVEVPRGQPPGVYSGAICAQDTQAPLGALTIEVKR